MVCRNRRRCKEEEEEEEEDDDDDDDDDEEEPEEEALDRGGSVDRVLGPPRAESLDIMPVY